MSFLRVLILGFLLMLPGPKVFSEVSERSFLAANDKAGEKVKKKKKKKKVKKKKKKSKGKKKKKKAVKKQVKAGTKLESGGAMINLLPFGINQFYYDKPVLGTALGLGQLAGGVMTVVYALQRQDNVDKTNAYIKKRNDEIVLVPPGAESVAHHDETVKQVDKFDAELQTISIIMFSGIGLAALSYVGSVVEAFVTDSDIQEKSPTKKSALGPTYNFALLPVASREKLGLSMGFKLSF